MEIGLFTHSNMCHSVRQHCRGTYGCCTDTDRNLSVHNYWLLDLHLLLPTFKVEPCAARSMSQICTYQQKCWCAKQLNDFHEFKILFSRLQQGALKNSGQWNPNSHSWLTMGNHAGKDGHGTTGEATVIRLVSSVRKYHVLFISLSSDFPNDSLFNSCDPCEFKGRHWCDTSIKSYKLRTITEVRPEAYFKHHFILGGYI